MVLDGPEGPADRRPARRGRQRHRPGWRGGDRVRRDGAARSVLPAAVAGGDRRRAAAGGGRRPAPSLPPGARRGGRWQAPGSPPRVRSRCVIPDESSRMSGGGGMPAAAGCQRAGGRPRSWSRPAWSRPGGRRRPGADPSPGRSRRRLRCRCCRCRPARSRPPRRRRRPQVGRAGLAGHPVHRGDHLARAPRPDQQRRAPGPVDHDRRRLVHGQPAPGRHRVGGDRGPHRLRRRAGGFLPALPAAARRPGLRATRGRDARGLRGDRRCRATRRTTFPPRPSTARFPTRNCGSSPAAGPSTTAPGRTSATRSSTPRKRLSSVLPRPTRAPATTLVTWPVTSTFTRTTRSRG